MSTFQNPLKKLQEQIRDEDFENFCKPENLVKKRADFELWKKRKSERLANLASGSDIENEE
jgi:hypothetical protein